MQFKLIALLSLTLIAANFSPAALSSTPINLNSTTPPALPNNPSLSPIQSYEKSFDFDWNHYTSIAANKAKLKEIEIFLKSIHDPAALSISDRQALSQLLYKLATFYLHVNREPDLAIEKLQIAATIFTDKQVTAWNDNHLAYAYEQKFALTGDHTDKDKALEYINKVTNELYAGVKTKEVAFAYCVQGLIFNDAKDYQHAEQSYQIALNIYETLPNGKDDQYIRAKNRLANIILDANGRDQEALQLLQPLKQYWLTKKDITQDPYAARNFITLGQAYLKTGNAEAALNEFDRAIVIYKNVYGSNALLLTKPYQLLSAAYKKLGKVQEAARYEVKVSLLDKA